MAAAFRGFADQVRLNRRQRAEEAGNKTAFKMLFPLVFCLAPAVFLILLTPAIIDLRDFFRREGTYSVLQTPQEQTQAITANTPIVPEGAPPPSQRATGIAPFQAAPLNP